MNVHLSTINKAIKSKARKEETRVVASNLRNALCAVQCILSTQKSPISAPMSPAKIVVNLHMWLTGVTSNPSSRNSLSNKTTKILRTPYRRRRRRAPHPPTLNFAPIECAFTKDQAFEPNLIYWSSEEDKDIHHATTINEFLDACEAMTEVEDDVRPRKVITIFHNLRGFDGNFLLKALYDQGHAVEKPLTQGAKILSFECGNLIFKDSLNFFAMPLERFPSTFI